MPFILSPELSGWTQRCLAHLCPYVSGILWFGWHMYIQVAGASCRNFFSICSPCVPSPLYQLSKGEGDIVEQNRNKRTLEKKKTQLHFTELYGPFPCWPVSFCKSVLSLCPMQLSKSKPKSFLCLLFTKETNVYWYFLHFLLFVPSPNS